MAGSEILLDVIKDCVISIESQHHGQIKGTVVGTDQNKTCVTLKDIIITLNNGNEVQIPNRRNYFCNDIKSLVILEKHEEIEENINVNKLSETNITDLNSVTKNYVYIDNINNIYEDAIKDLNSYPYIALQGVSESNEDLSNYLCLTLSTPSKIYFYDVYQIGHIDGKLKQILEEQEWPKKIMHDCRMLNKWLYKTYEVSLGGVFDTQIIDQQIRLKKDTAAKEVNLSTCMKTYLGINEDDLIVSGIIVHPLTEDYKSKAAKNISYMHLLSEKLYNIIKEPVSDLNTFCLNYNNVKCFTENYATYEDNFLTDLYNNITNI